MDRDERDMLRDDLAKSIGKSHRLVLGITVFVLICLGSAAVFGWFYCTKHKTESLAMAILVIVLAGAGVHGYGQRLAQLRREQGALRERIREYEKATGRAG